MASAAIASFGLQESERTMDDRLDAARALLGVSPSSVADSTGSLSLFGGRGLGKTSAVESSETDTEATTSTSSQDSTMDSLVTRRPRSNSAGLDALAFLATKEQASLEFQQRNSHRPSFLCESLPADSATPLVASAVSSCSSSSDDDSEAMPPPPPRTLLGRRRRSVSNPEGMEKWAPRDQSRLHFVLPASILEEELAEASAAMKAKEEASRPLEIFSETNMEELKSADCASECMRDEEEDENLNQNELLRRARSRLLEDLSEGNINGDKGVVTLPHTLAKYKEVR